MLICKFYGRVEMRKGRQVWISGHRKGRLVFLSYRIGGLKAYVRVFSYRDFWWMIDFQNIRGFRNYRFGSYVL